MEGGGGVKWCNHFNLKKLKRKKNCQFYIIAPRTWSLLWLGIEPGLVESCQGTVAISLIDTPNIRSYLYYVRGPTCVLQKCPYLLCINYVALQINIIIVNLIGHGFSNYYIYVEY